MIRDRLLLALQTAFPDMPFEIGEPPNAIAVFHAKHPEVGGVYIYDDEVEATVCVSEITHLHFGAHETGRTRQQEEDLVAEKVVDYLKAVFSDRVLFSRSSKNGVAVAGSQVLEVGEVMPARRTDTKYFLWSGPVP